MNKPENIKVLILADGCDFHSPEAISLPTALWPVAGKTVLERLLCELEANGIKSAVVSFNGRSDLLAESVNTNSLEVKFLDEQLPIGTAGCIRAAVNEEKVDLVLVFSASVICPPDINAMIDEHLNNKSDLTVMFNPDSDLNSIGEPVGIYVCSASILEHIPETGFYDIKESLIPVLLRSGKAVHAATLPKPAGNFQHRQGYLSAIADYLQNRPVIDELQITKSNSSRTVWTGTDTTFDPTVRFYGPVVVMDGATIKKNAVIIGPTVIGSNVTIDPESIIVKSVLWDDAKIGKSCEIKDCLIDQRTAIGHFTIAEEKNIPFKPFGVLKSITNSMRKISRSLSSSYDKIYGLLLDSFQPYKGRLGVCLIGCLMVIAFMWCYWPNLIDLWGIWQRSDEYSSGILVPFLAAYVLWLRRNKITGVQIKPSLWGLLLFVFAQAFRFFGVFFMYGSAERISIILGIIAIVLLIFGWQFTKNVSSVLLFLFLMIPWPNRVQAAIAIPLQKWATTSAVFCLETIGHDVVREGNVIHIAQTTIAVAEACNGLRMITAFFVIIGLLALIIKKPLWQKIALFISSLPIALFCNTIRLVLTSIAFTIPKGEHWEMMFHDYGGYAMMPLAIAIAVGELWLITKLTMPSDAQKQIVIVRRKS